MIGATITPALSTWHEWHIVFAVFGYALFFGLILIISRKRLKRFADTPQNTHEKRCSRKLGALK